MTSAVGKLVRPRRPGWSRPGWSRDPLIAAGVALLAAATVFAVVAGVAWLNAPRASAVAPARDAALRAGEQAVLNFNTMDYKHVARDLRLWEQSSTGALHRQILAGRTTFEQQVTQAQTVTTAKILDAALTSLNVRTGTARIIVALQLTVAPAHGTQVAKQSRLAGELTRTSAGWKLSALGQVPVQATTPSKNSNG
jgi:Mce-associated membrane protein